MKFVADKLSCALKDFLEFAEPIPVFFSGGISCKHEALFPLIEKHIDSSRCRLICLSEAPVDGALRQAEKLFSAKKGGPVK